MSASPPPGLENCDCILIKNKSASLNNNKTPNTFPLIQFYEKTFSHLQITAMDTVWEKAFCYSLPSFVRSIIFTLVFKSWQARANRHLTKALDYSLHTNKHDWNRTAWFLLLKQGIRGKGGWGESKPGFVKLLLFLHELRVKIWSQTLYTAG